MRSLSGSSEDVELQEAYKQYLIDQLNKDIQKTQQKIDKQQKEIDKIDETLDKLYQNAGMSSKFSEEKEKDSEE